MEASDRKEEIEHVNQVLTHCGYPSWTFKQVGERLESKDMKVKDRKKEQVESLIKTMVTMLFVIGVSEALLRSFRRQRAAAAAMKMHCTLR